MIAPIADTFVNQIDLDNNTVVQSGTVRSSELAKNEVISAFEQGLQGCRLPFRTVAGRFRLIDDAAKTVYIPKDEGEALVERLRKGERSRDLFRKLGQYGVSVYERHYQELMNAGCLEPLDEDSAILTDATLYDDAVGLPISTVYGTDIFV